MSVRRGSGFGVIIGGGLFERQGAGVDENNTGGYSNARA
jgi:hypothetical protein